MNKSNKLFNQGYEAYKNGNKITDNPYLYYSREQGVFYSAWWEAGFQKAQRDDKTSTQ